MSSLARPQEAHRVGCSEAIRGIEGEIECAALSDAKVLITGETGAGKEVVARLIHHRSPRASVALVMLNCVGLPDALLESELIGHGRGGFTGAYRDKPVCSDVAERHSQAGFDAHLVKPIASRELLETLGRVTRSKSRPVRLGDQARD